MNLAPLLSPRSIAVVGANDRAGSYADIVLRNLEAAGFAGPVWGVNPKRSVVRGRPCLPSLLDLPEAADAVVVAIPAPSVTAVLRDAIERGCGGAIVLSAGFGELESGRERERELRDVCAAAELPVCGPNGNGVAAIRTAAPMWGDSVARVRPGPVAMVSQSGNVAVNALNSRRGIGWHTLVSTGNQTVCDASHWLDAVAASDGVRSIALFCESDGDGERLAVALARAAELDVRVAVLKVGSSSAGAGAAAAHTGALAGDQRVFRALIEEAGGAWAEDPHELLELARVLAEPRARPRGGGGLAVLTCSGGDSGIAADRAELMGVELPELAPQTRECLTELLPPTATVANPLDWTAMIWDEPERLRRVVAAVGEDPSIDQLLMLFDQPRELPNDSAASWAGVRDALVAGAAESKASALLASTLPDLVEEGIALALAERGIPFVAGLRTSLLCASALRSAPGDPARLREIAAVAGRVAAQDRHRDAGDGWMAEAEAKRALAEAGIPVPPGRVALDAADAVAAAAEVGYPVALKLSSPLLRHKSELGGLALGLNDEPAVRDAFRRLAALPEAAGAQVLVERMVPAGVELLVAAGAGAVVPSLVLALGGIWTEVLDDVAIVPLPAGPDRVERALRSLRGAPTLTGGRGRGAVDLAAAARIASRAGEVLIERNLDLIELNPVTTGAAGAVALDAVVRASSNPVHASVAA
jgi:acetyl-CoA synthetase